MGKPYSLDLLERVVSAIEGETSRNQAAERFWGGAISTVIGWMHRSRLSWRPCAMTGSIHHGPSWDRSMASAFALVSSRSFCPPFDPAISSSWTTSAATGAKRFTNSSVRSTKNFLPAKILARPEPGRTGLCQAQAPGLRRNRPTTQYLHRRLNASTTSKISAIELDAITL